MCVNITDDTINAVWGDTRSGRLNIYFQRMSLDGIIASSQQLSSEIVPYLNVSPNPAYDFVKVEAIGIKQLALFDLSGRMLFQIDNPIAKDEMIISISEFPNGNYILRISSENGIQTRKILKK
jgi:hypothetical protein